MGDEQRPITDEERQAGAAAERPEPGYRRLARDPERRVLTGVCTGLGRYTGIDPVVYRVGFAILVLAHGQGIILYIAAALLMPGRPDGPSPVEHVVRRWFDAPAVLTILGALLCVGVAGSLFGGVSSDAIAIMVVFGLVLLVSHARGVDLVSVARTVPERLAGHPPASPASFSPRGPSASSGVSPGVDATPGTGGGLPEGMIDLGAYGRAAGAGTPSGGVASGATAVRRQEAPAARRERGGSPAASITLLAAMAAGAAMLPVANGYPAPDSWLIVMAPALAVIGLGLVAGGWLRTRGLATAGTVLTLTMLTTSAVGELPRNARYGDVEWRPTDTSRTNQEYKVGFGQGTLDLTALPLTPGQQVTIEAGILVGELRVVVPRSARVRLDARIGLGDLRVEMRTTSGPNARVRRVLEPEGPAVSNPPEIVLRIRGKVGDVEVERG
ncbi:PspC domain-containing protein [Actinomadura graeca]|uniref:PspC domain-containing protein n=1 Tax=Actinomadura graeca TaxID=2750812 RepID=A0ABX8QWQ0_9ACTN|nr:PspC domain-containing protein [Actinomadura graeca]QXJ22162.1 PspC domain-containing protein [Actinomadura graeca]